MEVLRHISIRLGLQNEEGHLVEEADRQVEVQFFFRIPKKQMMMMMMMVSFRLSFSQHNNSERIASDHRLDKYKHCKRQE